MPTTRGGEKLKGILAKLGEKMAEGKTLRVGFLENATYPDGTSVAMVGAIQNFGASKVGIPPRPFFSNMVRRKSPGWPAAAAKNLKATGYDAEKTLRLMGEGIRGQLQQSIRETNTPALAESTLAARGVAGVVYNKSKPETFGAKPLIDTGHMINSVDFEVV